MSSYAKAVLMGLVGTLGWWLLNSGSSGLWPHALEHFGWYADLSVPGLLLGFVEATSLDGTRRKWAAAGAGAFGGLASILISQNLSLGISSRALDGSTEMSSPQSAYLLHLSEYISSGAFGLLLGMFLSLPRLSAVSTAQYALGGLIGGVGGTGLLTLNWQPSFLLGVPAILRMSGMVGLTAFGIGIVPALFKQTWLTANSVWRREYPVVRKTLTLGSAANADMRVPINHNVAPVHAVIELLPNIGRRRLRHVAGGQGSHAFPATLVNGRPVGGEQWLADGDVVQVGSRAWTFHDRATRGQLRLGPAKPEAWQRVQDSPPNSPSSESGSSTVLPSLPVASRDTSEARPASEDILPPNLALNRQRLALTRQRVERAAGGQGGHSSPRDIGRVGTRLLCTEGPYEGRTYRLGPGETTIGRAASCTVSLPLDAGVAPLHARLVTESCSGHMLQNSVSSTGTWVNDKPVTAPVSLRLGDRVRVGGTTLRYQ